MLNPVEEAGGGGYYGGATNGAYQNGFWVGRGAYGGTSYINSSYFSEINQKSGVNNGNGYIKITRIDNNEPAEKEYLIKNGEELVEFTKENVSSTNEKDGYLEFITDDTNKRSSYYINEIDFTQYSKAYIDIEITSSTNGLSINLFDLTDDPLTDDPVRTTSIIDQNYYNSQNRHTFCVERANIKKYLLSINKGATTGNTQVQAKIYNLWLE